MLMTCGVLSKSERHVAAITADLDENAAELGEGTGDSGLKTRILGALRKTALYVSI